MSIQLLSSCVLSIVTRCSDHNNAGINKATNSLANRVVLIRVNRKHSETHVDDLDVVGRVVRHEPV